MLEEEFQVSEISLKNKRKELDLTVPDNFLNRNLLKKDRMELSNYFLFLDSKGRISKWPTIKSLIKESGKYLVNDIYITVDSKRARAVVISLKDNIDEMKSSKSIQNM